MTTTINAATALAERRRHLRAAYIASCEEAAARRQVWNEARVAADAARKTSEYRGRIDTPQRRQARRVAALKSDYSNQTYEAWDNALKESDAAYQAYVEAARVARLAGAPDEEGEE